MKAEREIGLTEWSSGAIRLTSAILFRASD